MKRKQKKKKESNQRPRLTTEEACVINGFVDLFKDEYGEKMEFTAREREIIEEVVLARYPHVVACAPTQYGKSTSVACGIIIAAVTLPVTHFIIGGTQAKADNLMQKVISHIFDHEVLTDQLKIDGGNLEKLRRHRNQRHITFKRGGQVIALTADIRNTQRRGESLLGYGGERVYIEDSVLMSDADKAFIMRMVAGAKNPFVFESGNALRKNHFYDALTDPNNYSIWFDYEQAIKDGRYTREFVDSMRKLPFFNELYACKFPEGALIDEKGWTCLLEGNEVDGIFSPVRIDKNTMGKRLGVDVAKGGNKSVVAIREEKRAAIIEARKTPNVMDVVAMSLKASHDYAVAMKDVAIDETGIGGGVVARLEEQNYPCIAFVSGGRADVMRDTAGAPLQEAKLSYLNARAECYWKLREWIKAGGQCEYNEDLKIQLKGIKYKIDSGGVIKIQPKDEMVISGCDSPDEADALMMTFAGDTMPTVDEDMENAARKEKEPEDEGVNDFESIGVSSADLNDFTIKNFGR